MIGRVFAPVVARLSERFVDRAWDVFARFAVIALLLTIWSSVLGVGVARAPQRIAARVESALEAARKTTPPTPPTPPRVPSRRIPTAPLPSEEPLRVAA